MYKGNDGHARHNYAGFLKRWLNRHAGLLGAIVASIFMCLLVMALLSGSRTRQHPPKNETNPVQTNTKDRNK